MHLSLLLALLAAPQTPDPPAREPAPPPRPNIVLIIVDTLRRDHLGCYGYARPTSPHIDQLAGESTLYTRATSQAPWTTPSIGALLSSQYPTSLGIRGSASALPDDVVRLPEVLRANGYATGAVISHSFCSSKWNFDKGFDSFDESNVLGHAVSTSQGVTDRALEFVERHAAGPFFLFVHYFDPHFAYLAHEEWDFAIAPGYAGPVKPGMKFTDLSRMTKRLEPVDVDQLVRFYDSEIAFTDREIGRLLDDLRRRGPAENTWIALSADHGEEFLDHGRLGHTNTLHTELLGVPLILRIPALKPGRVDRPVASVDLFPTLLDALQIDPPGPLVGRSLLGSGDEEGEAGLRPIFAETETASGERLRCVRMGPYKLVRDLDSGTQLIFNVATDPLEKEDLAGVLELRPELRKRVAALERALDAWIVECAKTRFGARDVELSEKERARLEELGYGEREE